VPFKGALLPITTDFPYDRFLIPLGVGISFVLISVLAISLKDKALRILVSILVALSVVVQFNYANTLRRNWNQYSDFLTQLVVRVPDIEKGTTLIAYDLPFSQFLPGNDLTASVNWIYGLDKSNFKEIPYYFIIMNSGQRDFYKQLLQDQPFVMNYRTCTFNGDPSKVILVQYDVDSCLTIVNKENIDILEGEKNNAEEFAALSQLTNLDLISLNSSAKQVPLSSQFKSSQKWCIYYEKASLEAQKRDWQKVIDIYKQAQELSLKPLKNVEWHPLIEAYVYSKNYDEASDLVKSIIEKDKDSKDDYCSYFQRLSVESGWYSESVISDAMSKVDCN
jgi:tetratricopeptide (TPR) repeat protein